MVSLAEGSCLYVEYFQDTQLQSILLTNLINASNLINLH